MNEMDRKFKIHYKDFRCWIIRGNEEIEIVKSYSTKWTNRVFIIKGELGIGNTRDCYVSFFVFNAPYKERTEPEFVGYYKYYDQHYRVTKKNVNPRTQPENETVIFEFTEKDRVKKNLETGKWESLYKR